MSPARMIRTAGPVRNRTSGRPDDSAGSRPERVDAARNRAAILDAADALFAGSPAPRSVSMDAIAVAAGVGKGTLFRRFGDRTGLVRAVFAARTAPLRQAIISGPPPLGPGSAPRERIVAILDAVVAAKLDNRHLSLAVEDGLIGGTLHEAPQYTELHALLAGELAALVPAADAGWTAHALLAVTRADLVDHLRRVEGMSPTELRRQLHTHLGRLLPPG